MAENVADFLRNASFGALTGAVIDAATEISQMPILNDKAPLVDNPNMSTAEAIVYLTGGLAIIGGLVDMGTGLKAVGGYGKEAVATGLGLTLGTYVYETSLAELLGIRQAAAAGPGAGPDASMAPM